MLALSVAIYVFISNLLANRRETAQRVGSKTLTQIVGVNGVVVEKLGFQKISVNYGDRKYLGDPRRSLVGHPDALRYLQLSRKRVFQQPQAVTQLGCWCN